MRETEGEANPLRPVEQLVEQLFGALRDGDAEGAASAAASAGERLEAIVSAARAGEVALPPGRLGALHAAMANARWIVDELARINGEGLEQILQLGSRATYGEGARAQLASGLQCWDA